MGYSKGEWKYTEELGANLSRIGTKDTVICGLPNPVSGENKDLQEMRANGNLIAAAPEIYKELKEADAVICDLCKRLNPQHAPMDNYKGCDSCEEREHRLKALAKADGR